MFRPRLLRKMILAMVGDVAGGTNLIHRSPQLLIPVPPLMVLHGSLCIGGWAQSTSSRLMARFALCPRRRRRLQFSRLPRFCRL